MAVRITYSLLVDGVRPMQCCHARMEKLERLFPITIMSKIMINVNIGDLGTCDLCAMPCVHKMPLR